MMNKCLYLRRRTKKGTIYLFCVKECCKGHVNTEKCHVCPFKEYKKVKPIKKVSKNKVKVSHETYNEILNKDKGCRICHTKDNLHLHHVFEGKNRNNSTKYKMLVMLCQEHHRWVHETNYLGFKQEAQKEFEKAHTREEFIKIFGRNYL